MRFLVSIELMILIRAFFSSSSSWLIMASCSLISWFCMSTTVFSSSFKSWSAETENTFIYPRNQLVTIPDEVLMDKIYVIRGKKALLDNDLAALYEAETRRLKEQV
jgi:hypothetical protein